MQLSPHFSLEELIASQNAARLGIPNTPDSDALANLRALASSLEKIRTLLGCVVIVTSGFRSPALNAATPGSSKTSMHMRGLAADVICPQFGAPYDVCKAIVGSTIQFDQVIFEYGQWCHFGLAAPFTMVRQQVLTIRSAATGYEAGLVRI